MTATYAQERRIRFSDCDPAGIVFYPQYFVMFNGLVEDWIDSALEVDYARLLVERRIGLPTVRLEADFRAVSRLGDAVRLQLELERLGARSLTLQLCCSGVGDADDVRMTMRQVIVTTSLDSHKSIPVPADLCRGIERVSAISARA